MGGSVPPKTQKGPRNRSHPCLLEAGPCPSAVPSTDPLRAGLLGTFGGNWQRLVMSGGWEHWGGSPLSSARNQKRILSSSLGAGDEADFPRVSQPLTHPETPPGGPVTCPHQGLCGGPGRRAGPPMHLLPGRQARGVFHTVMHGPICFQLAAPGAPNWQIKLCDVPRQISSQESPSRL